MIHQNTPPCAGEMEEHPFCDVGHRGTGLAKTSLEYVLHWHTLPLTRGGQHGQRETLHCQGGAVQDVRT